MASTHGVGPVILRNKKHDSHDELNFKSFFGQSIKHSFQKESFGVLTIPSLCVLSASHYRLCCWCGSIRMACNRPEMIFGLCHYACLLLLHLSFVADIYWWPQYPKAGDYPTEKKAITNVA